jgi:hypothetical protein
MKIVEKKMYREWNDIVIPLPRHDKNYGRKKGENVWKGINEVENKECIYWGGT